MLRREHPRLVKIAWAVDGSDFADMALEPESRELARERYHGARPLEQPVFDAPSLAPDAPHPRRAATAEKKSPSQAGGSSKAQQRRQGGGSSSATTKFRWTSASLFRR
jgi:hypothetical protein